MRKLIILLITIVALAFASRGHIYAEPAGPERRDLSGDYIARGVGVDGKKYDSKVKITAHGGTYEIRWHFADRDFVGICIQHGDTLSVGWSNEGKAAVAVYVIHGDRLEGRWSDASDDGKVCDETLTRIE